MNKSKFLKKSLATLLAIMMVVAMIPLSAFATDAEAPADPAPAPKPVITVNNRNAEAPTEAGGAYTASVDDATTVSISWVPLTSEGWTAYLKTLRDVKVKLPFYSLDLTKEADVVKDYDPETHTITYQVDVILEKGTEGTDDFVQHTYYLDITAKTEAASDDVTLEFVKPNQSFRIGTDNWNFVGIEGTINENDTIVITLPLGYTPTDAGFGTNTGSTATSFGSVAGKANGTTPTAGTQLADQVYSNVFRPTADYSTVSYSYDSDTKQGRVTVTARDGRSKNYTVLFTQEAALTDVSVTLLDKISTPAVPVYHTYPTTQEYFDTDGVKTYVIEVPVADVATLQPTEGIVNFTALDNVVRVEDPHDVRKTHYATNGWAAHYNATSNGESQDEPVISGKNTFVFNNEIPANVRSEAVLAGNSVTYLTVKTEANMAVNSVNVAAADDGNKAQKFYTDVKIVLVPKTQGATTTPSTVPQLVELQLNGYKAVWAQGAEIGSLDEATGMRNIDITVDDAFYYSVGNGQHPARISMTLKGASTATEVSIPAQAPNKQTADPYWAVPAIHPEASSVTYFASAHRTNKPTGTAGTYIDNVKVEGGSFVLRVANGSSYQDYNVRINRPAKKNGTNVNTVKLYWWNSVTQSWVIFNSTAKDTNNNFNFELPAAFYTDAGVTGTGTYTAGIYTTQNLIGTTDPASDGDGDHITGTFAVTDTTKFKALVEEKLGYVAGAATVDFTVKAVANKQEVQLLATVKNSTPAAIATATDVVIGTFVMQNPASMVMDLKVGTDVVATLTIAGKYWDDTATPSHKAESYDETAMTAGNLATWMGTAKAIGSATYVPGTAPSTSLNADLSNAYLVIDSDPGAVVTPGGLLKNGKQTTAIGNSIWGADNYNGNYPTSGPGSAYFYTELEEGFTKLGSWWNAGVYNMGANNTTPVLAGGSTSSKDYMYFTVTNGRREQGVAQTVYSISFSEENTTVTPPAAESTVGTLTFGEASSYVDEDLIFSGNTVKNAIIVTNSGISDNASTPAPVLPWAKYNQATANDAYIEYTDAKYVGAKTEKNTYKVLDPQPVSNDNRAHVIVVEVPENFLVNQNGTTLNQIVFDAITKGESHIAIYNGTEYNKIGTSTPAALSSATEPTASLSVPSLGGAVAGNDVQKKQTITNFTFTDPELNAWNGNTFIPGNVRDVNTLYTYSEKAQADTITKTNYTEKYYITVRRVKNSEADQLTDVKATDKNSSVYTMVNQSRKTITVSVPYSYNWVGSRDGVDGDFNLEFLANSGAIVIDANRDAAFKYRDLSASPSWVVPVNFALTDLVKQQQDLFTLNESQTYFVKNGELFAYNAKTGAETQITGAVNGTTEAFMNRQWGLIQAHEAEIRVYPETRANVNTYKLNVEVRQPSAEAAITRVLVDETEATIEGTNITVELPVGAIKTAVRVAVSVSPMAKIVSIDGKPYNPNDEQVYDLSKPIPIVIAAENGTSQVTYTLTADIPDQPTPPPTDEPTPPPTTEPPVDINEAHSSLRPFIMTAIEEGLMQGNGKYFYPLNSMKRYEFALVVARAGLRAEGETGTAAELDQKLIADYATCDFADVTAMNNAAVSAAVQYVFDKGYMKGISDTAFAPNGNITREQAALTMARVAGLSLDDVDATDFSDNKKISSWAIGGVNAAVEAGIMTGDASNNTFRPLDNLSRAEGACILVRYFVEGKGQQTPDEPSTPTPDEGDDENEGTTPPEGEGSEDEGSTPATDDDNTTGDDDTTGGEESSEPAE